MTPVRLEPAAPRSRVEHTEVLKAANRYRSVGLFSLQEFSRAAFLQVFTRSVTLVLLIRVIRINFKCKK